MFKILRAPVVALTVGLFCSGNANAGLIIDFSDVGNDMVMSVSGTLDTGSLSLQGPGGSSTDTFINGGGGGQDYIHFGNGHARNRWDFSNPQLPVFVNPVAFGTIYADNSTGDSFLFWNSGNSARVFLADGFVSGSSINATATFLNFSLADLGGINAGTISTGSDTIEFTTGGFSGSASVPNLGTLLLGLIGMFGIARQRAKT